MLRIHYGRQHGGSSSEHMQKHQERKQAKSAKTLSIVVGAFFACWLPFFICHTISGRNSLGSVADAFLADFPSLLLDLFTWLGYMNSALNPLIYALAIRSFSQTYSQMSRQLIGYLRKKVPGCEFLCSRCCRAHLCCPFPIRHATQTPTDISGIRAHNASKLLQITSPTVATPSRPSSTRWPRSTAVRVR